MESAPGLRVPPLQPPDAHNGRGTDDLNVIKSKAGKAGRPVLQSLDAMPEWFRRESNPSKLHSYRPISGSARASFSSWSYIHNGLEKAMESAPVTRSIWWRGTAEYTTCRAGRTSPGFFWCEPLPRNIYWSVVSQSSYAQFCFFFVSDLVLESNTILSLVDRLEFAGRRPSS